MVVEAHARLSNHLVHVEEALRDGAVDPLVLNTGHVELAELGEGRTEVAVAPGLGVAHVVHLPAEITMSITQSRHRDVWTSNKRMIAYNVGNAMLVYLILKRSNKVLSFIQYTFSPRLCNENTDNFTNHPLCLTISNDLNRILTL